MMYGYIYLLREREFIKNAENIYKIGYTNQNPNKRFNGYPRDSELLLLEEMYNANIYEKQIIKTFKNNFINRRDIGLEYFEGNRYYMCNIILKICNIREQTDLKNYNINRFKINDNKLFETKKTKYYSPNKDILHRRNRVKELQKEAYYDRLENENFLKKQILIINREKKTHNNIKTYTLNDIKKEEENNNKKEEIDVSNENNKIYNTNNKKKENNKLLLSLKIEYNILIMFLVGIIIYMIK